MTTNKQLSLSKDMANKKLLIVREFDAGVEQVWRAWTESDLLEQWWAPKPWRAETKSMDFREGGKWHYAMVGPDGERMWAMVNYLSVRPNKGFTAVDAFCDEHGKKDNTMPSMNWKNEFSQSGSGTKVTIQIDFENEADIRKILEMGFEEGFTAALGNLDELLSKSLVN